MKQGVIYAIKNNISNNVYIGQTTSFKQRKICHLHKLRNNSHHCVHLQNSWNQYGESCFYFEIIEHCALESLNEREQYWIDFYEESCFNTILIAGRPAGNPLSIETKERMSIANSGINSKCYGTKRKKEDVESMIKNQPHRKPILQVDIETGTIIREFDSVNSAAKYIGCGICQISDVLHGIGKTSHGYIWKFKNKEDASKKARCPVEKLDLRENIVIEKFSSISDAARSIGVNRSSISHACHGNLFSVGGYRWRFSNENTNVTNA